MAEPAKRVRGLFAPTGKRSSRETMTGLRPNDDARHVREVMPRYSAVRRAQAAAATVALGCILGAALPAAAYADVDGAPAMEQSSEVPGAIAADTGSNVDSADGGPGEAAAEAEAPVDVADGGARSLQSALRAPLLPSFYFNTTASDLVVPYGVDIPSWLNQQEALFLDSSQIWNKLSAAEVARAYFGGNGPFEYRGDQSSYPSGVDLSTVLAWVAYDEDAVHVPRLTGISGIDAVAHLQAVEEPEDIACAPSGVLEQLRVTGASGGEARALAVSGSWGESGYGDMVVWLRAGDGAATFAPSALRSELVLSGSYALELDGSFSSDDAGSSLTLGRPAEYEPQRFYVKIPRDTRVSGTDTVLSAGQVLRVEVRRDEQAPTIGTIDVRGASGEALDRSGLWIDDSGRLTLGSDGFTVVVPLADVAGDYGEASGIDADDVRLTVADADGAAHEIAPRSIADDGTAVFAIDTDSIGTTTIDLAGSTLTVRDVAGNEASASLATAPFFAASTDPADPSAAITRVRLIDARIQAPTVTVSLRGDEDDAADGDGRLVSNASQVDVSLTLTDSFYAELRADASWAGANPVHVQVDGADVAVDPAAFAPTGEGDSYTQSLPALMAEGSHTIAFRYTGVSAVHAGLGEFSAQGSAAVLIDRTAPTVDEVEIGSGVDADLVAEMPSGERLLASEGATVSLHVGDIQPAGVDEVSGIASITVRVPVRDGLDDPSGSGEPVVLTPDANGIVELDLTGAGYYDFSDIELTLLDRAGNERSTTLAAVLDELWGADALDGMVVASNASVDVDLAVASSEGAAPVEGFYPGASAVTLTVNDPWFSVHACTPAFANGFSAAVITASGTTSLDPLKASDFIQQDDGSWVAEIPFSRDESGALADGTYELSFALLGARDSLSFGVDATAPQVTEAEVENVDADNIADLDGFRVLATTGSSVRVRVQDLLPRSAGDPAPDDTRDEDGASGVATDTLEVSVAYTDSLESSASSVAEQQALVVDERGWAEVQLSGEGVYRLDDIVFYLADTCGNERRVSLADYVAALPADERESWAFDAILVDASDTLPAVSLALVDDADTPESRDPYYHRGEVSVTATIDDPWFRVYQALHDDAELMRGNLREPGADEAAPMDERLYARDFVVQTAADGSTVWTATFLLPRASANPALPVEGDYRVSIAYGGVAGSFGSEAVRAVKRFGVDYTAPGLGALTFSDTATYPMNDDGEPWGWLFAEEEEVSLDVTDNLSGVDMSASRLTTAGIPAPELAFEGDDAGLAGAVVFAVTGDGTRLYFDGTGIVVADRAGNVARTGDFSSYGATNLPEGATGVAIDTSAPEVTLDFDNNDVRNGHYYNAGRTGTVTVSDASFDLIKRFDPEYAVVVVTCDGRHAVTLTAKAFERVVLDDGSVVYRASHAFEDDADWEVTAQVTDPLGHSSQTARDVFVVDTQAPVLTVEFDNDDVANGMYYKATRRATITVRDRNFAPGLGSIDAQTLSGGSAPVATGFGEIEPRSEWRATASFTGEEHYRLQVAATDLAGNTAEPFDSGEFVIDMTAPEVSISGVESGRAYAGTVAPSVSFSDANLDTAGSTATLEGVRSGMAYTPNFKEDATETEKVTDFGNLPYEIDCDDVYTVRGEAIDLAGNTAQVDTRFSVNRFGSTYYFASGSENIAGAYLSAPQDVRIVEVNVSGIDTARSRVELAHDDRIATLEPGTDYDLSPNANDDGWSATTYTLPAELFDENGYYRVLLTSTDDAGNLSQNTMSGKSSDRSSEFPVEFAIDATAPTANLVGVSSAGTYLDPAKTAIVDAGDNLEVSSARLTVDGVEVASWDARAFSAGALPEVELTVDGRPHTYVLEVRDRAGNVSTATYDRVLVTGDWLTFVLNTPALLMGSIGGGVVLLGIIGAIAYLAWRRRRLTRARRNPFGHGRGGAEPQHEGPA